uniref:Uncharacterized protein n=1 Tax=Parascaris equorum TaxID=6256 RepID=A0A914R2B0_PAREQ
MCAPSHKAILLRIVVHLQTFERGRYFVWRGKWEGGSFDVISSKQVGGGCIVSENTSYSTPGRLIAPGIVVPGTLSITSSE